QEVHLDLDDTVALASLAAAALDIEREASGLIPASLGFWKPGKPIADRREGARIGSRIGAWGAADRRLIDVADLVDQLQTLDTVVLCGVFARAHDAARSCLVERLDQEGGLAAARNARDTGECAERNVARDVLQVVAARTHDANTPLL